jgi:hypothetical protein
LLTSLEARMSEWEEANGGQLVGCAKGAPQP